MKQETQDVIYEVARGGPAVAGAVTATVTLNEWAAVVTLLYVVVQLFYLLRKWWAEEAERAAKRPRGRR